MIWLLPDVIKVKSSSAKPITCSLSVLQLFQVSLCCIVSTAILLTWSKLSWFFFFIDWFPRQNVVSNYQESSYVNFGRICTFWDLFHFLMVQSCYFMILEHDIKCCLCRNYLSLKACLSWWPFNWFLILFDWMFSMKC